MLNLLGLDSKKARQDSVSVLVGPNGSGKSSFLRALALRHCNDRNVVIVCNTPHDRYSGLRGAKRISVGKTEGSPRVIVKKAVAQSLAHANSEFYQISSTLEYCGYRAQFGFRIDSAPLYGLGLEEIRSRLPELVGSEFDDVSRTSPLTGEVDNLDDGDLERALAFLRRHDPSVPIWIDASKHIVEFSRSREFASVLKFESRLRALNVIRGVRVYLQPMHGEGCIELQHASSGQLALISSLLFMITNAGDDPVIIIDEPENSLHPNWQREYVDKVLTALSYRNATVILATHAPLIVTGALASSGSASLVSVFLVAAGTPRRLSLDCAGDSLGSIEEILWRAFEVVTPANHFVSEQIVDEVSRFEKGQVGKDQVLALIAKMEDESFDGRQRDFFIAVRTLLDKVEVVHRGPNRDG